MRGGYPEGTQKSDSEVSVPLLVRWECAGKAIWRVEGPLTQPVLRVQQQARRVRASAPPQHLHLHSRTQGAPPHWERRVDSLDSSLAKFVENFSWPIWRSLAALKTASACRTTHMMRRSCKAAGLCLVVLLAAAAALAVPAAATRVSGRAGAALAHDHALFKHQARWLH